MQNATIAARAILFQFQPACGILFVFGGGVVTFLTLGAGHGDDFILFLLYL